MEIGEILIHRIRAVNFNKSGVVEIFFLESGQSGINAAYRYSSRNRDFVSQVHIPKIMAPSLLGGKKNRNLDEILRF